MTISRPNIFKLATAAAVFVCALLLLTLVNRSPAPSEGGSQRATAPRSAAERIRALEADIRAHPERTGSYSLLGEAYLQRARETGDPANYGRAEAILERALKRRPRDAAALTGLGALAAARHDFGAALELGRRARRLAPDVVRPYGVVVDSLVELGRYDEAGQELQRMIDLKPNLASYARVSYYRELQGNLNGALEAMTLAVSAGGDAPEQVAYVQTLLGDLHLDRHRLGPAREAYRLALGRLPGYVDARFGLARAEAQAGGLRGALGRLRTVVADRPDPDHLAMLGEVELRLGIEKPARRHFARARKQERRALAGGANPDAGMVLLETAHGDPAEAIRLGRAVWAKAPSVTSADAVGWALTSAGRAREGLRYARRALRLGTRSAAFNYHAGIAARDAGRPSLARRHLRTALRLSPAFSPREALMAQRALDRL